MNRYRKPAASILLMLLFASFDALLFPAPEQDAANSQTGTRIELIEEQQKDKARNLSPAKPAKAEQALEKYIGEDPLNKYAGGIPGLRLRLGGLPSGAGLSVGPEYTRTDLAQGRMSFRARAVGSNRFWYLVETEVRFPHLGGRNLGLDFTGRRLKANSLDYYGPGPDSQKNGRSDFSREEKAIDVSLSFKPSRRYVSVALTAGYLQLDIDPGKARPFISSEEQYPPTVAIGIDKPTDYLRSGLTLDVDSRDRPKDPAGGTHFLVKLNQLNDRKYAQYSFRQIDASMEQYLPFFNQKRVIALRARSVLSYPCAGNEIPFYMQPTLGGASELRGYRHSRFYDNNSFLINAEYRWEVFTLMDAALFTDAGKVFHRDGEFNLEQLESDVGFGFRFKVGHVVVFRIDTAFSHEGFGSWFAFDHIF